MNMIVPSLKYLYALFTTNLKAALALRGSFLLQSGFMIANNAIFFCVWLIFFNRYEEINGWRLEHMAVLYGMAATAFGLWVVVAGGVRDMARIIVDGDLDSMLTLPKNVLIRAAASRMEVSGFGDIVTGIAMIALSGVVGGWDILLIVLCVICSALLLTAANILMQCVAFWAGPIDTLGRQFSEFMIIFSSYPANLFSGVVKLVLFTVVPAGAVSYLPLELVVHHEWRTAALYVGITVAFCALALWVFGIGLKRYESGNRFGAQV